ncbi:Holliday junction branch migration protein RuvA [Lactobacillus gigeriorum]|uniref:Holliday junction branch migration complex subunit RuvA n=1 Tax=Lactobacillus gigeriorum DSM 23908 = CRBIP 24.85 TaxID=1423751 RepID=I7LE88_9LACO|nr:Holliday junction branch migration protein RuvA [Lactobacillus gigeriorum]KRN13923.1 crossover junction ATP-dependent DNA helicase RuvA [Lactobacillus gigeriorum DSM 23908 = CRBIP 24.85]CCI87976.1 Holliday junction ATP-dependent DNA helicase RuvA [Lactobacillus gigeriorum DSM 23908 = CRBIP 24.85]
MFEYLEGTITEITPAYIVVDVNGIGYKVFSPTPFAYRVNEEAKVFVEQIFSENNGFTLYGFESRLAKGLFLKLLSVSGIGPKSALAIMAAEDSDSLAEAIEQGEVKYLTRFPGVGKKTASQIVLDLKGKLGDYVSRLDRKSESSDVSPALHDALLALLALGYTQKEVDRITPKLSELNYDSADQYIKKGLALLLKK